MRKDMAKVIVERPRRGLKAALLQGKTHPLEDEEGEPLRARTPKRAPPKTKYLNENLKPLERFIESAVGRSWNKVYAEISENLRVTNAVQQHVRDHLEDIVAVKARMEDGAVMTAPRNSAPIPLEQDWRRYFVHPRTGLLKRNPHWKSWSRKNAERRAAGKVADTPRRRILKDCVQLHLLEDGAWWRVKLHGVPQDAPYTDLVFRAGLSALKPAALYGRDGVYAAELRALTKAEKKELGLKS